MSDKSELRSSAKNFARNPVRFLLPLVFCLLTLLTGCVRYDVGINFDSPYSGTLVQHIKIGEQLSSFGESEAIAWLKSIESRSRRLQAKVEHLSPEEIVLIVPFKNAQELNNKFNTLFNSNVPDTSAVVVEEKAELVKLGSGVSLQENNLLLVERNHLDLTIDLRALNLLSNQGKIAIEPNLLLDLEFNLNAPWIVRNISNANNLEPIASSSKQGLVWKLESGKLNHIGAVFWLPNPIGIGAVLIILLMILGFRLKYGRFPDLAKT